MYKNLFKAVKLWSEYQDERSMLEDDGQKRNKKEEREHQIERSFTALTNIVWVKFRDTWKYSEEE